MSVIYTKDRLTKEINDLNDGILYPPKDILLSMVNSLFGVYGNLYVANGVTQQNLTTDFVKFTGFTNAGPGEGVTVNLANDSLDLLYDGMYLGAFMCSFSGTPNALITFQLAVDGTPSAITELDRKLGTGGDLGSATGISLFAGTAGQELTVQVKSDGTDNITAAQAAFTILRIG